MVPFVPPQRCERLRALGSLIGLPGRARRMLQQDRLFAPIWTPSQGEWLSTYREPGQTFHQFRRSAFRPDPAQRRIYLLPLEGSRSVSRECRRDIRRFLEAFFCLDVCELPVWNLGDGPVARRADPAWGVFQWCAGDVLKELATRRPGDAFCVLALAADDIYPHALVDYAFGLASDADRVGVCSLARFGPPYCAGQGEGAGGRHAGPRECRLVAHEIGHMIGIRHCVYYRCLMNGAASLAEGDARPLHLCPVDLRKLQWVIGFDLEARYRGLQRAWLDLGAQEEAAWIARRLLAP